MALQHTRLISKVFQSRISLSLSPLSHISKHHASDSGGSGAGAPYRPWPATKYNWEESAKYWTENGWKPASAESDEYEKEEVYLHQIEERLRTYDKKYSDSDEIKKLYNEFSWDPVDDRAFYTYGNALGSDLQYGPGKKIDPSHYITPEWTNVNRKSIPPIQYMTADQIRRSRGTYSSVRELPPEQPSIWRFWNAYSCLGSFGVIMLTKEFYVTGGHDMFEAVMMWGFFGLTASVAADWFAWWHTLVTQESYDREYFPLITAVRKYNDLLERYNNKPNEKKIIFQLQKYREGLAEKVLSKTLNNRLGRIFERTVKQLEDKISEEAAVKKDVENNWKRTSLNTTLEYFENDNVRTDFMGDSLNQFCAGDIAKLSNETKTICYDTNMFKEEYTKNFQIAKNNYLDEQKNKGSLNWVFVDENERTSNQKSSSQKEDEYNSAISQWAQSHNSVSAPSPSFS